MACHRANVGSLLVRVRPDILTIGGEYREFVNWSHLTYAGSILSGRPSLPPYAGETALSESRSG